MKVYLISLFVAALTVIITCQNHLIKLMGTKVRKDQIALIKSSLSIVAIIGLPILFDGKDLMG